jgi:hypothetical protein
MTLAIGASVPTTNEEPVAAWELPAVEEVELMLLQPATRKVAAVRARTEDRICLPEFELLNFDSPLSANVHASRIESRVGLTAWVEIWISYWLSPGWIEHKVEVKSFEGCRIISSRTLLKYNKNTPATSEVAGVVWRNGERRLRVLIMRSGKPGQPLFVLGLKLRFRFLFGQSARFSKLD